jgi:hypothetical protein
VGDGVEQSKYIAEPPQHTNDNDHVQYRLDGTCHWDEAVDQPQDYANDDQSEQYLTKGMICYLTLLHAIVNGVLHDTSIERKKLFTCEQPAIFGEL